MEVFFGLLLLASMALNCILIWYIKRVMSRSSLAYNATNDVIGSLQDFVEHLDSIDELRAYYGDQDFKNIVEHAKILTEDIAFYRNGFIFDLRGDALDNSYTKEETQEE